MLQTAAQGQRDHEPDAFPARLTTRRPALEYALPGARSLQLRTIVAHMAHLTSVRHTRPCPAAAPHRFLLERLSATLIGPARARSAVPHILVADNRAYQAVFHVQYQPCQGSPSRY